MKAKPGEPHRNRRRATDARIAKSDKVFSDRMRYGQHSVWMEPDQKSRLRSVWPALEDALKRYSTHQAPSRRTTHLNLAD